MDWLSLSNAHQLYEYDGMAKIARNNTKNNLLWVTFPEHTCFQPKCQSFLPNKNTPTNNTKTRPRFLQIPPNKKINFANQTVSSNPTTNDYVEDSSRKYNGNTTPPQQPNQPLKIDVICVCVSHVSNRCF